MMSISGVNTGAVQPLTTAEKVLGASKVQKSEEESQGRQLKPVMDEYVPEESQEPSGRYWMGKDEDGQPKIYFDDPERAADTPKQLEGARTSRGAVSVLHGYGFQSSGVPERDFLKSVFGTAS